MNANTCKRRTTGHPILPADLFLWFYDHKGVGAAMEVLYRVQEERYSVEEVNHAIEQGNVDYLLA